LIALGTPHELKLEMAKGDCPNFRVSENGTVPCDAVHDAAQQPPPSPPSLPSLEEVFVARIEARDRADQPQQEVPR
jgi:hypothetical protein